MRILSQSGMSTYSKLYKTFCRNCNSAPQDLFGAKKEFTNLERIFIPNNRAQELTSRTEILLSIYQKEEIISLQIY